MAVFKVMSNFCSIYLTTLGLLYKINYAVILYETVKDLPIFFVNFYERFVNLVTLDPDLQILYGSGSSCPKTCGSMQIRIRNTEEN